MEVVINRNDIEEIIKGYSNVNNKFCFISYVPVKSNMWRCKFFDDGKECSLDVYLKEKSVNFIPTGKNKDLTVKLVEYISSKGFESKTYSKSISVKLNRDQINDLLRYLSDECKHLISYEVNNSVIRFKGYNEDRLVLNYYEETSTAVFQGKPFFVFSVVMNYIAVVANLSMDDIIRLNNEFSNMNTPISLVRDEMKLKLGNAYYFLDEILLKFISGSFSLLKSSLLCEEYSGYVVGMFKSLEGYMKYVLKDKYKFCFDSKTKFTMLGKGPDGKCDLSRKFSLSKDEEVYWDKLYVMYQDKRNVYLHATVDPIANKVLESKQEAIDLADEIVLLIKNSYKIFYK